MRLVFSVFFDIENYEDFFYRIIQSRLKCVESEKYLINVETLEQICNTQIEPSYSTHPWEGYVFLQKDSFVIFRNNDSDGYFSFVHNIATLYNIRTVHIRIYDEKPYPGYFLTYYENQNNGLSITLKRTVGNSIIQVSLPFLRKVITMKKNVFQINSTKRNYCCFAIGWV